MDEEFLILLGLAFMAMLFTGSILGLVAFIRSNSLAKKSRDDMDRLRLLERRLWALEDQFGKLQAAPPPQTTEKPTPQPEPEPKPERIEIRLEKPKPAAENIPTARPVYEQAKPLTTKPQGTPKPPISIEEKQPAPKDWSTFEEVVGKRWMTWVGTLVLFLSVAFFVKYAFDNQWVGPAARIILGLLIGIGLTITGHISIRREMRPLGQGLIGGGLAVLYVSLFAALSLYQLISPTFTFVCMLIVTILGMSLAVLHNALPIAVLAVLGGLLTPILVSTGKDARDALFAYLLVLNLGVLGVAFVRKWRALDILAFVGTFLLYTGWHAEYYKSSALIPALLWLGAFYLIYVIVPFAYHLRNHAPIPVERFAMSMVNAVVTMAFCYAMLYKNHPHVLGFIALSMAAGYVVLGSMTRKRIDGDPRSLFGFVTLAVILLTLAVPLHLRTIGITLAWAIEAPVLLYLGYRFRYRPVRVMASVVLIAALFRLFAFHWPLHSQSYIVVFNKHFASALFLPVALAAFAFVHHLYREKQEGEDEVAMWGALGLLGFVSAYTVSAEVSDWTFYSTRKIGINNLERYPHYRPILATLPWLVGSAIYFQVARLRRSIPAVIISIAMTGVTSIYAVSMYTSSHRPDWSLFFNPRFAVGLATVILLLITARQVQTTKEIKEKLGQLPIVLWIGFGVGLWMLLSVETYQFSRSFVTDYKQSKWAARMALSIIWALYASAMLIAGFWKNLRPVRLAALALFGLTALKVILFDMAGISQIYRIVSFVVLGALMLGASYLYNRMERTLTHERSINRIEEPKS